MKQFLKACIVGIALLSSTFSEAQTTIRLFDTVLFYDGYATIVDEPTAAGKIRLRNDLFTTKLTEAQLGAIGTDLTIKVIIGAACDNYDRIGSVNLALVPKGQATYVPGEVEHIEVGRFITPFMNKNVQPDTVPYVFQVNNIAHLLKESSLTAQYDFWVELEVFGVPYAANEQVAGCAGRNDVFYGTLDFVTNGNTAVENNNRLVPLSFKANFNNYQDGATDTAGTTTRTITFSTTENLTDAVLFLITSNHGANSGGEEYNRRNHYAYFDNDLKLTYKPGRTSCEPFRVYNTQGNGIYGSAPRSDAQWQSFSNWCPGDVIDIRPIELGAVAAGAHAFMIRVPDAVFNQEQGNIPLSVYLQGKTSGTVGVDEIREQQLGLNIFPNPTNGVLNIFAKERVSNITFYNQLGQQVQPVKGTSFDISMLPGGIYWVQVNFENGMTLHRKIIKD